jgi:hypothetical protein
MRRGRRNLVMFGRGALLRLLHGQMITSIPDFYPDWHAALEALGIA